MNKSPFTTIAAVLLILVALMNIGGGVGQYAKAAFVQGTTEAMAGFGSSVAAANRNNPFAPRDGRLEEASRGVAQYGAAQGTKLYLLAALMVVAAVLQITAAIGVFANKPWRAKLLFIAAIAGTMVELIDMARSGFALRQVLFLAVYAFAGFVALPDLAAVQVAGSVPASTPAGQPPAVLGEHASADPSLIGQESEPGIRFPADQKRTVELLVAAILLVAFGGGGWWIFSTRKTQTVTETRVESAQPSAARSKSPTAPNAQDKSTKLLGSWYDGGPFCAHISRDRPDGAFRLELWYCNVGISEAAQVRLQSSDGELVSVDRAVRVSLLGSNAMKVTLVGTLKDKSGNPYSNDSFNPKFERSKQKFR